VISMRLFALRLLSKPVRGGLYIIIWNLLVSSQKSDKQVCIIWIHGTQMSKQSLDLAYMLYLCQLH